MNPDLYQLVYCSRNLIRGKDPEITAELQAILSSSRRNNYREGITGALLYTTGMFAQVLEGPLPSIERIFEAIQRDLRHSEVTIVHSGPATGRDFPEWSMAFAGGVAPKDRPLATAAFDAVFAKTAGAGDQMLSLLKDLVKREDDWILLDGAGFQSRKLDTDHRTGRFANDGVGV